MSKKTKVFKLILAFVVIAIGVGITIYLIPVIKDLSSEARSASI